jgi:phage/plasmid-like protein (TIGR03299 family)
MAHMIESEDSAMFYKEAAWHGIGTVVETAPSPSEALKIAGLDWSVLRSGSISATYGDDNETTTKDFTALVRSDTGRILSVQSPDYKIVQNEEMFDLAYSLGEDVKVESAFSMGNGTRVVCLLRGETFAPTNSKEDLISKYMCLVNSHNGTLALSALPTSIRVVCNNTLSMALSAGQKKMYRVVHSGNMNAKKEAMQKALTNYKNTGKMFEEHVNVLSSRTLNVQDIQRFWLELYGRVETPVVGNPKTEDEYDNYIKAQTTIAKWSDIFDAERRRINAPASMWVAVNAATNWMQHRIPSRGKIPTTESRNFNNIVGSTSDTVSDAVRFAMSYV